MESFEGSRLHCVSFQEWPHPMGTGSLSFGRGAHGRQHFHWFITQVWAQHSVESAAHCRVGGDPAELRVAVKGIV